jgi:hypothetical protein
MPLPKLLAIFRPTNLVSILLLAGLGVGGYHAYQMYEEVRIDEATRERLEGEVAELQAEKARLEMQNTVLRAFVDRLTTEARVAEVEVIAQGRDAQGVPVTTLEFKEIGRDGQFLPTKTLEARGTEVYFDALVIKFVEDAVKEGDPLRGKSLHLFRRVFGDAQQPRHGEEMSATTDGVPDLYRVSKEPSPFERRLWMYFWKWMDNPELAAQDGVRVAQVEAVAIRPKLGAKYRVTLELDGGLNIKKVE